MIQKLQFRLQNFDWNFIKGSTIVSMGVAVARVLGLIFSLVLARAFTPQDYGAVQYALTLANIVCIGTQPFVQHVLARFVGKYKDDAAALSEYLMGIWTILLFLTLGTFAVAIPVLLASGNFNLGILVIFIGTTVFYSYYGLARGQGANYHLLAVYLGSNVVQVVVIVLVVYVFGNRATLPALVVYGSSYFLPILIGQVFFPLKLGLRRALPKRETLSALLKFSFPIWITHASYMLYITIDVLLLNFYRGTGEVGVYALSKTLSAAFGFIPLGITTILMPKVAGSQSADHGRLLRNALTMTVAANIVGLVIYGFTYNWFVNKLFGARYVVEPAIFMVVAVANILFGIHQIISSVYVGSDHARRETISLVIGLAAAFIVGLFTVPAYGAAGAATMALVGGTVPLLIYAVRYGSTVSSTRDMQPAGN